MEVNCIQPGNEGYAVDLGMKVRHVYVSDVSIWLKRRTPDEGLQTTISYVLNTLDEVPGEHPAMYPAGTLVYLTQIEAEAEKQRRIDALRESFRKGEINK